MLKNRVYISGMFFVVNEEDCIDLSILYLLEIRVGGLSSGDLEALLEFLIQADVQKVFIACSVVQEGIEVPDIDKSL